MNADMWKQTIRFFIEPHPTLHPAGEQVFVPRHRVAFFFDGGLRVEGDRDNLQINFNNDDMLVLAIDTAESGHVYRIPWPRLVCFELIRDRKKHTDMEWPPRPSFN